jgi:hypothetical protein
MNLIANRKSAVGFAQEAVGHSNRRFACLLLTCDRSVRILWRVAQDQPLQEDGSILRTHRMAQSTHLSVPSSQQVFTAPVGPMFVSPGVVRRPLVLLWG